MIGTLLNTATVLIGGAIGLFLGARLPQRLRQTTILGIGLFTLAYGVSMFLETQNSLIVLGSLIIGIALGEWWQIEAGLERLGVWLEDRFQNGKNKEISNDEAGKKQTSFVRAFMTASLVFCVGPMAILGSIQDGLTGDYQLLVIKSILDFFGAVAFASTLGVGVLFSALIILVYQGAIALLAVQAQSFVTPDMMTEMTAVGGILLLAIAISSLLEIRKIRVGNFLPALIIAPIMVGVLALLNVTMP